MEKGEGNVDDRIFFPESVEYSKPEATPVVGLGQSTPLYHA